MIGAVTAGWRSDERERQLDERHPGLLGQPGERVGGLELALVAGQRQVVALRQPRPRDVGSRRSAPLRNRPVSQPPASGLHGITPIP